MYVVEHRGKQRGMAMNACQREQCKSNAGRHFCGFQVDQIFLIKNQSRGKSEILSPSGRNLSWTCFIGLAQSDKGVIKSFTPRLDLVGERIIQNYK